MTINEILKQQGWELVERKGWVAIQDHRPGFYDALGTNRVGKIVGTRLYVTLTQFPEKTKGLIRQLGYEPISIKSTNIERDVTYWGFDTKDVPDEQLKRFVSSLAAVIDDNI